MCSRDTASEERRDNQWLKQPVSFYIFMSPLTLLNVNAKMGSVSHVPLIPICHLKSVQLTTNLKKVERKSQKFLINHSRIFSQI